MSISSITGTYGTGFNPLYSASARKSVSGESTSSDTVQISAEARDMFTTIKRQAEQKASSEHGESVGRQVAEYWEKQPPVSEGSKFSTWLPENYEKYLSMMEEAKAGQGSSDPKNDTKIRMVFDALGADKVITDKDIAEGVAVIRDEDIMKSFSLMPTTDAEWDAVEHDITLADEKLAAWKANQDMDSILLDDEDIA